MEKKEKEFSVTKRMLDLMLERKKLNKVAKQVKIIFGLSVCGFILGGVGLGFAFQFLNLYSLIPILCAYGSLAAALLATGYISKVIPVLENKKKINQDFKQLMLEIQSKVSDRTIDANSFRIKLISKKGKNIKLYYPCESEYSLGRRTIKVIDAKGIIGELNETRASYEDDKSGRKDNYRYTFKPEGSEREYSIGKPYQHTRRR